MKKKIAIRTDGGQSVGMGHVMRCLSLAKELRKNNYKVIFISKYKEGIEKIKSENFEVIKLTYNDEINDDGFNYGDKSKLSDEKKKIQEIINKYSIKMLIIDSYNVTKEYFLSLKDKVEKLIYIDDINKFIYPVDVLINGNITGKYMGYEKYTEDELMLLGLKYNMIRDEFKNLSERNINKNIKEVMITTGGSDPYGVSIKILEILLSENEFKNIGYNLVIGKGFSDDTKNKLYRLSKKNSKIKIYENPRSMSNIMVKSDIAISSGGSTLYELCATGTPTLAFIYADNQEFIVKKMDELGYITSIGNYNEINKSNILDLIEKYNSYETRKNISKRMSKLIDGKGTERIVEKLDSI